MSCLQVLSKLKFVGPNGPIRKEQGENEKLNKCLRRREVCVTLPNTVP